MRERTRGRGGQISESGPHLGLTAGLQEDTAQYSVAYGGPAPHSMRHTLTVCSGAQRWAYVVWEHMTHPLGPPHKPPMAHPLGPPHTPPMAHPLGPLRSHSGYTLRSPSGYTLRSHSGYTLRSPSGYTLRGHSGCTLRWHSSYTLRWHSGRILVGRRLPLAGPVCLEPYVWTHMFGHCAGRQVSFNWSTPLKAWPHTTDSELEEAEVRDDHPTYTLPLPPHPSSTHGSSHPITTPSQLNPWLIPSHHHPNSTHGSSQTCAL